MFACDLIEHDGADLRDLPLVERKRRLARLIGKSMRRMTAHAFGCLIAMAHRCVSLGAFTARSERAVTPRSRILWTRPGASGR